MSGHGHQPQGGVGRPPAPTTGSGVKRASTLAWEDPPAPLDPARALEDAVRVARATSHARRLDTSTQAALQAMVAVAEAVVDLVRIRDRELGELRRRVDRLAGVTFGDP